MATKPASTYILDSTNSLYASMAGCWPMLEGSGSTTADKTTNAYTATLVTGLAWGTPDAEGPNLTQSSGSGYLSLVTPGVVIPINTSFSLAWGCYDSSSTGTNGIICGDKLGIQSYQNFVELRGSNNSCTFQIYGITNGGIEPFYSLPTVSNRHDYLLTGAYSAGTFTFNLYVDGSAQTPITGVTPGSTPWDINGIMDGYTTAGYNFYGQFEYFYVWSGRALASTDATTLHTNPYSILKSGSSSGAGDRLLESVTSKRQLENSSYRLLEGSGTAGPTAFPAALIIAGF